MQAVGASRKVFKYTDRKPAFDVYRGDVKELSAENATVKFDDVTFSYPTRPNSNALQAGVLCIISQHKRYSLSM